MIYLFSNGLFILELKITEIYLISLNHFFEMIYWLFLFDY